MKKEPVLLNQNRFYYNKSKQDDKKNISKDTLKKIIASKINISLDEYEVYFNISPYETYNAIINAVIFSFKRICKKPHIICNKMEDELLLKVLDEYETRGLITINYVKTNIYGSILSSDIEKLINNKTCLIINSLINKFTGAINNIEKINEVAHSNKIPLLCDNTFNFGILPISRADIITFDLNIPDLSIMVVNKNLITGYKLFNTSIKFQEENELHCNLNADLYKTAHNIISNKYHSITKLKKSYEKITNTRRYLIKKLQSKNNLYYYHDIIKNDLITKPGDVIIFGSDIDALQSSHIFSFMIVSKSPSHKFKNVKFCDINLDIFDNLGVSNDYKKYIISAGISDTITKKDIDNILK